MDEDLSALIERFRGGARQARGDAGGRGDEQRIAEQQALVAQLRDEIEARGLSNVALTQQDERIAQLMVKERELLGIIEEQNAARARGAMPSCQGSRRPTSP